VAVVTRGSTLRVVVTDGRGRLHPGFGLSRWLARVAPAAVRGEIVVALVCDRKMRAMNRQFRGVDRPTDVLSFPSDNDFRVSIGERPFLGDIVIATGVASRQAVTGGHTFAVELRRLSLHGLLHLIGYDHAQDSGQMERLERRLWRKAGMREGIS
jgi:probable rRNA maturation factor